MLLGEKIRNARVEAGLTQEELAEMIMVSRPAVAKWEGGVSKTKRYQRTTYVYLLANKRILLIS